KYQPNQHARALITNRSHLLGMVAPDLMHSYFAEILRGIESVARPAKLRILVCNTYEDADNEIAEVEALRQRTDGDRKSTRLNSTTRFRSKYQPNQHARALITNRSHLLGMVAPDLMHSYFAEILRGIESVARPAKLRILVCNTYEDADNEIAEVEALRQRTD